MCRLAAAIVLSSVASAQTPQAGIALAAKSPIALARYVESHRSVDWKALKTALDLKESHYSIPPCGGNAPATESPCSAETVTVADPDQVVLIVRGGDFSYTVEYLRYLRDPNRGWKFAGEYSASKWNGGPSRHALVRLGNKPFLKISSNHDQNGMSISQELEDWFELSLPGFEPVFSYTLDGGASGLTFTMPRAMKAESRFSQAVASNEST